MNNLPRGRGNSDTIKASLHNNYENRMSYKLILKQLIDILSTNFHFVGWLFFTYFACKFSYLKDFRVYG